MKAVELAPGNPEAYQLMASCLLSKNNEQVCVCVCVCVHACVCARI